MSQKRRYEDMTENNEQHSLKRHSLMILFEKAQYEIMMYNKIRTDINNLNGKIDYLSLEFSEMNDKDEEHDRKKNQ